MLRGAEKRQLALALKGASAALRDLFFSNMSERTGKLLREDMASMGPIRRTDVDEAQGCMVNLAKEMASRGEIVLSDSKGGDELVY